jgi:hypothetical protein
MFQFTGTPGCEESRLCKGGIGCIRLQKSVLLFRKETLIG